MRATLALAALSVWMLVAPVSAQLQFGELGNRMPVDNDYTHAVALGDVDGDGDLDTVLGSLIGQNRLYLNGGTGIYTDDTASRMPVDSDVTLAVALADVDGDGDLDAVFGNDFGQDRLYVNDGSGAFDAVASMPVASRRTWDIQMGDVDGDGDLDMILAIGGDTTPGRRNRLYLNDGAGTFTDSITSLPALLDSTYAAALGDVDGDGDLDLVFGNGMRQGQRQNRLYLNDGSGTYGDVTSTRLPVDDDATREVQLADVDGDGDLDIIFGNAFTQNRLHLNDGTGTYTDATASNMPVDSDVTFAVEVGDVDGDGDPDLILASADASGWQITGWQARLYLNDGTGVFVNRTATHLPVESDHTRAVALGEVDGDGDLDLVLGNGSYQQNRLYSNDGKGTYTDVTAKRMPIVNDGTKAVATGDVDGDGDLDIVFGNGSQSRLYLNDGNGNFTDVTAERMPVDAEVTEAVALGDIDGDGDLDIVLGNVPLCGYYTCVGGQNRLYLNDGTGTYTDATAARMPSGNSTAWAVALGDVDGDLDLDIVLGYGIICANYSCVGSQQNRLFLNDGTGRYTDATAFQMPIDNDDTRAVALGDVDGDGDLDLVLGNGDRSGQQNRLYLNDGVGSFTDVTAARMPGASDKTRALGLDDVDGDGDFDLVFGNFGQQNRLYLNAGDGTYTDATAAQLPIDDDDTGAVVLGDADGDLDLDIVFGNCTGQNRLHVNDGTGSYADVTPRIPLDDDNTNTLAMGDVDGDGDMDLVLGNGRGPNRLYLNLLRQLDAPLFANRGQSYEFHVYARYGLTRQRDVAQIWLSTGTASLPVPPIGTFGLDPTQMIALPLLIVPQPSGRASLSFTIPNAPSLTGAAFYAQALLVHDSVRIPAVLTNVTADVVQ